MRIGPRASRSTRSRAAARRGVPALVATAGLLVGSGAAASSVPGGAIDPSAMDKTGDGLLTVGLVVAGDSEDGGFYQGQVESVQAEAEALGMESVIVDQVNPQTSGS